ncbi:MAG TPA: LamG domain-containing protein, partial [Luteolibacter sp.]
MSSFAGVWAHYPFDTGFTDVSGNSRDGALTDVGTTGNSGIVSSAGNFKFGGGAVSFAADRDFMAVPLTAFASGSSYTIAFWARKTAGDTGNAASFDMVIGDRNDTNHFIAINDSAFTALRWRGGGSTADRQADFTLTNDYAWHHYAIVASGTTVTLYRDGNVVGSGTNKQTAFQYNSIGEAYTAAGDYDFNGQLDEMWVFDEALSAAAVTSLFQSNDPIPASTYAGFHHRYDGNFNDSGAAGNYGAADGAATITTDPGAIAAGAGALSLDGADASRVILPVAGSYTATQPWTATWWARRGAIGTDKGMVMGRADNMADFIWLNDRFTGLRFCSSNASTFDFTIPKDTELRHYALVA